MAHGQRRDVGDPVEFLRARGFEPIGPYPGRRSVPWPAVCKSCGKESAPYISWLLRYPDSRCRHCAAVDRGLRGRVSQDVAAKIMRDAGVEPMEPYQGKARPWRCTCMSCGRIVTPIYDNVRRGQSACAYCAGTKVDVAEVTEKMIDAGFEPQVPFPGVAKPWRCRCVTCNREVAPQFQSVARGRGCGFCARNRVDPADAVIRLRSAGMEPLEPFPGAHAMWKMRCLTCGVEDARSLLRAQRRGGCIPCNLKRRADGDRLPHEDAVAVMDAAQLRPLEPYTSAHTPWLCECLRCGAEVRPTYRNVKYGSHGCVYCAARGIAPAAAALVYLVIHEAFDAIKVGIAIVGSGRVESHQALGWEVHRVWDGLRGDQARSVEREVLRWWRRDLGLPFGVPTDLMPQAGYTETASLHRVSVDDTIDRVAELIGEAQRESRARWGDWDLNPGVGDYESPALPTELPPLGA